MEVVIPDTEPVSLVTEEVEDNFNTVQDPRHKQLTISSEMRLARIDVTLNKIGKVLELIYAEVRDGNK